MWSRRGKTTFEHILSLHVYDNDLNASQLMILHCFKKSGVPGRWVRGGVGWGGGGCHDKNQILVKDTSEET